MDAEKFLCEICTDPGRCCRAFPLNIDFPLNTHRKDVVAAMRKYKLPFIPLRPISFEDWKYGDVPNSERWLYTCPEVTRNGRCRIYKKRPHPCKVYEPGYDSSCTMYNGDYDTYSTYYPGDSENT